MKRKAEDMLAAFIGTNVFWSLYLEKKNTESTGISLMRSLHISGNLVAVSVKTSAEVAFTLSRNVFVRPRDAAN